MANPILEGWIDPSSNENSDLPLPNEVTCGLHLQALRKYKKDNGLRLPALHRLIVIITQFISEQRRGLIHFIRAAVWPEGANAFANWVLILYLIFFMTRWS